MHEKINKFEKHQYTGNQNNYNSHKKNIIL